MKISKGETLNVLNLPAHWLEDYHARIQAGMTSDLNVAADQLSQVTGASKMNVALIVDTPKIARELNKILLEGNRAFAGGQAGVGHRFDRILVMATMTDDRFSEWFDHFKCCLTPKGKIIYD